MTQFDIDGLGKALESYDVDKMLGYYSPTFEHIEIDADAPPRSPRKTGADYIRSAVEGAKQGGVKFRVENGVAGSNRAACTINCELPDGRHMISNTIYDLADGKIVRQLDVQVMDPES